MADTPAVPGSPPAAKSKTGVPGTSTSRGARKENPSLETAGMNPGEPAHPYLPGEGTMPTETEYGKPGTGKKQAQENAEKAENEKAV